MPGLKLAAGYSYPPANLGFCGTRIKNTPSVLVDFIQGKSISLIKIRKILENFEASYPYLQLIARVNKISDPFNNQVVEAYWLGNNLLDKVKLIDLKKLILNDFTKPRLLSKKEAEKRVGQIPAKAKPHHSFHVLVLRSITGKVKFRGRLYDLCRISWGKVMEIKNRKLKVKTRPLLIKNNKFLLGKEKEAEIDWNKKFLPEVKKGDRISFHWNFACQIINKKKEENLLKYTLLNIKAVNEQHK